MSFFYNPLPLLSVAIFLLLASVRAQDTVTVVSNGNVVATTTGSGGAQPANVGAVIPIVPPGGGLVMVSTVQPAAASTITPPPSPANPNPDCQQCSIYFQYINAYYWPTENTNNTACLSGVTDPPTTALPSGLTPVSPSVYLVFPTISAGNACTQVGKVYISQTFSFAPAALSTMVGTSGVVQPFNFADLPCPPPDVAAADNWFYNPSYNPGRAYAPMVSPPPEIFAMDPAFANCVAAVYQGFDPPYPMPTFGGNFGVDKNGGGGWRRKRTAPAHMVPSGPVQTSGPTL